MQTIEVPPQIKESLQCFSDYINCTVSYSFCETPKSTMPFIGIEEKFQNFSRTDIVQNVRWFEYLAYLKRYNMLTKTQVFALIRKDFAKGADYLLNKLEDDPKITNLLQIQIEVTKTFFGRKVHDEMLEYIMCADYNFVNMSQLIEDFILYCKVLSIVSVAFEIPNEMSTKLLKIAFLRRLPDEKRKHYMEEVEDISEDEELEHISAFNLFEFMDHVHRLLEKNYHTYTPFPKVEVKTNSIDGGNSHRHDSYDKNLKEMNMRCFCCNLRGHVKRNCSLKNLPCTNCFKKGHIAKICRSKKCRRNVTKAKKRIHKYWKNLVTVQLSPSKLLKTALLQEYNIASKLVKNLDEQSNRKMKSYQKKIEK